MYASYECHKFASVDPVMMILICTCSAFHALHVGVLFNHVRVDLDILIPVAKVHVVVNC